MIAPQNLDGEFEIDARSDLAARVVENGSYEPEVTRILSLLRHAPGTVVNIGANIGFFPIHIARTFKNVKSVVAIEPNPDAFSLLLENIQRNGCADRIQALQMCIGAEPGNVELATVVGKPEYSSIGSIVHKAIADFSQTRYIVPVLPLNDVVKGDVSVIVADVEGAEMRLLEGASAILDKSRPIILIECSEQLLGKFGNGSAEMMDWLFQHRYTPYDVASPRRPVTTPFEGELLVIPEERVETLKPAIFNL